MSATTKSDSKTWIAGKEIIIVDKSSSSEVKFDGSKISKEDIVKAVNETGYRVSGTEPIQ